MTLVAPYTPPADPSGTRPPAASRPGRPPSRNRALDGLRGLAVVAVVVFHFAPDVAPGGYLGVDVFFVLSGFLITRLFIAEARGTGGIRLKDFWARRFRRLLPAALVTIAAVVAVGAFWDPDRGASTGEVGSAVLYVANWREALSGTSYFDAFAAPSPLRHFWSLAIEEQFYLVAPLVIVLGLALVGASKVRRQAALVGLVGVAALSAVAMVVLYGDGSGSARAYYGTDARAFEILAGVLLAVLLQGDRVVRRRRGVLAAGLAGLVVLIGATALLGDGSGLYFRGGAVVVVVATGSLIAACVSRGNPVRRGLSLRPLAYLGVISYGIYLYHWPIAIWVDPSTVPLDGVGLFAMRSALTLGAAAASFAFLERPLRSAGRRDRTTAPDGRPAGEWIAIAVVVVAVLLIGVVVIRPGQRDPLGGPPIVATAERPVPTTAPPTFARVVTAPAATTSSWLSIEQADQAGGLRFIASCLEQQPLVETRAHGTGRLVSVIGDSINEEIAAQLMDDATYDWFMLSRCGLNMNDFIAGTKDYPEVSPALDQLVAARPAVLIISLSAAMQNRDIAGLAGAIDHILDRTSSIPCRMFVNSHPDPEMDHAYARVQAADVRTINEAFAAAGHPELTVLDWDGTVNATPLAADGYHPYLDPSDWLHLVPGQGDLARIDLMKRGIATCPDL